MAKSDYGKRAFVGSTKESRKGWLRAFGVPCPKCKGKGVLEDVDSDMRLIIEQQCPKCEGIGYIEKEKK